MTEFRMCMPNISPGWSGDHLGAALETLGHAASLRGSCGPVCLQSDSRPPVDCQRHKGQDHFLAKVMETIPPMR